MSQIQGNMRKYHVPMMLFVGTINAHKQSGPDEMAKLTQYVTRTISYTHASTGIKLEHITLFASDRNSVYEGWQNFMVVSQAELTTQLGEQMSFICKMHYERVNGKQLFEGMGETEKVIDFIQTVTRDTEKWTSKSIREVHTI